MQMKRRSVLVGRLLVIACMTMVSFSLGTFVFWGTGCACDGPNRFAGINPFRDRAPEWAAQEFFLELSSGRCKLEDEVLCRQALKNGHVTEWRLATRESKNGVVILYYDARYHDPAGWPTSVSLTVQLTSSGWKVISYGG